MITLTLDEIPEGWFWQISNPPIKGKHKVGKKYKDAKYTVYMHNGELFATKYYTSVWIDGDDIEECWKQAIKAVHQGIADAKEAERVLRNKVQRKDVQV
jgi:hypothetical protein